MRRNYIFDTIRTVFRKYGYLPIETPAMENIETLTGKYGEEGDQLLFRILNSRLHESKTKEQSKKDFDRLLTQSINSPFLTEKALRYDLTVPFARYVVQHQNDISFPFKRYQIQPVWRGDRPAKGRYREFYQCDADVIGSASLINELELVQMMDEVFTAFRLPVIIKINNRKILSGIAEILDESENIIAITVAIDKLDKVGVEGVNDELRAAGIKESSILKLQPLLAFRGDNAAKLRYLKELLAQSENGVKGIGEMEYLLDLVSQHAAGDATVEFDITLARGLNYYTGAIFEVKVDASRCGSAFTSSITGGGRYDDLTGIFGLPGLSGVGISFGADRIYDVLLELGLYPDSAVFSTRLLFVTFGQSEMEFALPLLAAARKAGISAEIYPDAGAKMKKQMGYADGKKIPFVAIIGSDEVQSGLITFKNMSDGTQEKCSFETILTKLTSQS